MDDLFFSDRKFVQSLLHHVHTCLIHNSEKAISNAINWLYEINEFDAAIVCKGMSPGRLVTPLLNHSFSKDWVSHYVRNQYWAIDPVVETSFEGSGPFTWAHAFNKSSNKESSRFITSAADHGLAGGYAYSWHRPSDGSKQVTLFSISNPRENNLVLFEYAVKTLLPVFACSAQNIRSDQESVLTHREIEVLQWSKSGKSVWETSRILSLSDATVKFHLRNIYKKLQVSSKTQAIAMCIGLGIL